MYSPPKYMHVVTYVARRPPAASALLIAHEIAEVRQMASIVVR
jgi:hypothetical protein